MALFNFLASIWQGRAPRRRRPKEAERAFLTFEKCLSLQALAGVYIVRTTKKSWKCLEAILLWPRPLAWKESYSLRVNDNGERRQWTNDKRAAKPNGGMRRKMPVRKQTFDKSRERKKIHATYAAMIIWDAQEKHSRSAEDFPDRYVSIGLGSSMTFQLYRTFRFTTA